MPLITDCDVNLKSFLQEYDFKEETSKKMRMESGDMGDIKKRTREETSPSQTTDPVSPQGNRKKPCLMDELIASQTSMKDIPISKTSKNKRLKGQYYFFLKK